MLDNNYNIYPSEFIEQFYCLVFLWKGDFFVLFLGFFVNRKFKRIFCEIQILTVTFYQYVCFLKVYISFKEKP